MKPQDDEIKKLIDESYSEIDVPEGLESRLSAKIDSWAAEESDSVAPTVKYFRFTRSFWIRSASIAASLVLLVTGTLLIWPGRSGNEIQIVDTCTSVEEAYKETQQALSYISQAFGKGMEKVGKTAENLSKSTSSANKYVSITEKE